MLEIATQAPLLLRRYRHVRDAIVALCAAIVVYLAGLFAIAGASLLNTPAAPALLLFVAAPLLCIEWRGPRRPEIRISQSALEYEVNRVASLHH